MSRPFSCLPLLLIPLLAGVVSCTRSPQPSPEEISGAPVLLRMETKAGGSVYEGTFRVAMFNSSYIYSGRTGSYCSLPQGQTWWSHPWLPPCRVDEESGDPLDAANAVSSLEGADHDSRYGLRYTIGNNSTSNVSLVALAPAIRVIPDGTDDAYAYVQWSSNAARRVYISAPVAGTFTGTWVDREYVYTSDNHLSGSMTDPSATVTVRVECGELTEGDIQRVSLTNLVTSARFYLISKDFYERGFSFADGHYTTTAQTIYDCGAGAPDHLVRADGDFREYEKIFFPAAPYSDNALDYIRPVFMLHLGPDKTRPLRARVVLNQDLEPMTHYTLTLLISRAVVSATLAATATWDAGGNLTILDETVTHPASLTLESAWIDGGSHDAEDVYVP